VRKRDNDCTQKSVQRLHLVEVKVEGERKRERGRKRNKRSLKRRSAAALVSEHVLQIYLIE
jgi:hypothetical protein